MRILPRHLALGLATAALLMLLQPLPGVAANGESAAISPYRVKAAFLRNFAHYVIWPGSVFVDARSPWRVCILGWDPFGEVLDKTLQARTEQDRPFEIVRAETPEGLPACQIVYVAYHDVVKRRAALALLKSQPVLTVGEAREFLAEGGMIRLQAGERVEMSINLDRMRAASLHVQTKMLEVCSEVLENGILRSLR